MPEMQEMQEMQALAAANDHGGTVGACPTVLIAASPRPAPVDDISPSLLSTAEQQID